MMNTVVDAALMRRAIAADAERIAELATSHPATPVPSCPGWDIARLGGHLGRVHRMTIGVLTNTVDGFADGDSMEKPPTDPGAIPDFVRRGAAELDALLAVRDPESPCWNFLHEPMRAYFWFRRQAHEAAVHRWDAENALTPGLIVWSVDPELAVDGVDEYWVMARERLLPARNVAHLGGSLHLHATDVTGEWMIKIDNGVLCVDHGHGKGTAAVRGVASDLFLGLWGRYDLRDEARFEQFGAASVIAAAVALGGT